MLECELVARRSVTDQLFFTVRQLAQVFIFCLLLSHLRASTHVSQCELLYYTMSATLTCVYRN